MNVRPYVETIRRKEREWQEKCRQTRQEALECLPDIVRLLKEAGATRIVLFGSIVDEGRFHPGSDIDLAVEGIDWSTYWSVLGKVERIIKFPVDIVILEDATPEMQKLILETGREVDHGT